MTDCEKNKNGADRIKIYKELVLTEESYRSALSGIKTCQSLLIEESHSISRSCFSGGVSASGGLGSAADEGEAADEGQGAGKGGAAGKDLLRVIGLSGEHGF